VAFFSRIKGSKVELIIQQNALVGSEIVAPLANFGADL